MSTELSRKQLEELHDWKVGVTAWRSSLKQPQTRKKPANCKPLKQTTLQQVNQFYTNNTNPAGNTTRYAKGNQVHVPARSRSLTKKQLHTQYSEEHSKGTEHHVFLTRHFFRLEPNFLTKAKRKLDMCELCVRGEEVERELAKRRRVGSSFEGLSTDEADSAAKNLRLHKAHKSVVSSQHQSFKAQQENLQPGEVLVVLDFKKRKFAGWIWSNRSWKRLLHQNPSSLLLFALVETQPPTILTAFPTLSHRVRIESFMKFKKCLLWKWNSEFLWIFFCFSQFLALFFPIFDCFLFFFADFPFGWIVDLTFVATKWWTTFFVKEHRSTKLKQLESMVLLNIMANQQWTHTFLTFLVLWVNVLWPSTLQTLMTSKRRLLRTLGSPKLQWQ